MDRSLMRPGIDRPVRVVLADDDCVFRASLRQLLSAPASVIADVYGVDVGAGCQVVGDGNGGEEMIERVAASRPDLLLLAVGACGLSRLQPLRARAIDSGELRTILLSETVERPDLIDALALGVRGIVMKDAATEVLFEAIACVMGGRYWMDQALVTGLMEIARQLIQSSPSASSAPACRFTRREREIVQLVVAGYGNKEIAQTIGVGEDTVKHHLTRVFAKCGVDNRVELAIAATERGLLYPGDPASAPPSRMAAREARPSACHER